MTAQLPPLIAGRPIIGVMMDENTSSGGGLYETSKAYFRAIEQAGGIGVGLVYDSGTPDFALQTCHGLVVCGGRVQFPADWYANGQPSSSPQSERIACEGALVSRWIKTGRPYLGICHGMQTLAALHGAKLTADLRAGNPQALVHDQPDVRHPVTVAAGTKLAAITGETTLTVNSLHREAVVTVPDSIAISAYAPDGTIEAIELKDHAFALGLQWHPERLAEGQPAEAEPAKKQAQAVFSALIVAASTWV
jgi:putative glutamine amidotransferase